MGMRRYLAMTAAEIAASASLPEGLAYMACHFSPYGTGLSNIPASLPSGSLLTVNDSTPICRHDPERIAGQLREAAQALGCWGVLLDFQRPGCPEIQAFCDALIPKLECPVGVSALYAEGLSCPVLLPPCPVNMPLEKQIAPWKGREIWLEIAPEGLCLTVTKEGCAASPLPPEPDRELPFSDSTLHCHYTTKLTKDAAIFSLYRTEEDIRALLAEAEAMGIPLSIGLYQQLGNIL